MCPHCGFQCVNRNRMKYLLYEQHKDPSWVKLVLYKCEYCGHSDISRNGVKEHVKNVHEIKMGKNEFEIFFYKWW